MKKKLSQWLEYLESIHPSEIDLGLARVEEVAKAMDLIKPTNQVLMVAGTNGKGSTVTMSAQCLLEEGLTVGQYMSPHLHVYNERVRINGEMASDEDLVESFEAIDKARGDITLTYFEVGTLSALYLFKKHNLDVSVLEVGLGGRLDAVNVVEPDVSIVTSIGLDHQDWLGSDVSVIAFEKAGIYRSGKPAICGQLNPPESLANHAACINANLYMKGQDFEYEQLASNWGWSGKDVHGNPIKLNNLPLPSLPIENAATALQGLLMLRPGIKRESIENGLVKAQLAGRLQSIPKVFNGFMDVGHNPQAAQLLSTRLKHKPIGKRHVLLAMLEDKDAKSVVESMDCQIDQWHLAGLSGYRGQSVEGLKAKLDGLVSHARCWGSVAEALDGLKQTLADEDELVILGSFITVAQATEWLEKQV